MFNSMGGFGIYLKNSGNVTLFTSLVSTVLLIPPREFAEVSSTLVKGLVGPEGWRDIIRRYVPDAVYEKILKDHKNIG